MSTEQTFIAVKPDAVQRGLIGYIISKFELKGYKLRALKFLVPSRDLVEEHYAEHKGKPFYEKLVGFMASGPVCAMIWEGKQAVKTGRLMLGASNPLDSAPGTIRGDYGIDLGRNVCHGSDSIESANREIKLWFQPSEIQVYDRTIEPWIYE
ncbi:Nucleoside diphosphate kinase [Schizosaccharomyces pombe]|uniref:Nucleoside diphosphate kinase n=1 Tax=Schizosaccharomyces pombe (strain 972 / ATCC 24843) TaxID=284812 RepID=NDK_SCHPO|nr:nucleoside diphosphate kinase Ndk1 [Schizosaccharomyces pombe]P49740.1 RecName: Full=Nucleoside diphosphate kinase; Short=NDK; Short=NDP kinase [Schizosaccharomyces pombe 972h-]BAA09829.1 Nucleoside Diphosphate Kinase [Schizosaccharomyces pombe]CAB55286.1 nucleoside diphosphate kinase Ndk1 [Schizosaccharomyces pombe]|eukprot:NP_592857.1 nucleoside diphosphate kinase Ndk1 [Schizosaccharomyces pombe]